MTRLVLGVLGHVDHGKTSLVRALTGVDTDRLAEEKQRGISIALGFAHLLVGSDTAIDLVDMPGHERFVRTMIAGATGIDAILLVVAANEGIKPQTREHVDIAALLGLKRAIVAITKADLVEPAQAAAVANQAVQLLSSCGLTCSAPILTVAQQETGIGELRAAMKGLASRKMLRANDGIPFLPIDRAFSMAGHGPVVTGTLRGAALAVGDTVELLPSRHPVRIRSLQVHGIRVGSAGPGQRVAVNLRDIDVAVLKRGMALAECDALTPAPWITLSIRTVHGARTLKNGMRLTALYGTDEAVARLRLLDTDTLESGQSGFAQLHFAAPVALLVGEHVILRLTSPSLTVAGGKVLEVGTERRRRNSAVVAQRLADLAVLPPAAIVAAEIERHSPSGVSLRSLSQLSALRKERLTELLKTLPVFMSSSGWVVRVAAIEAIVARVPGLIASHATGLSRDELASLLPEAPAVVLDEALDRLLAQKLLSRRGSQYVIHRPEQDRANARADAQLAQRIADTLRQAGLTPPHPRDIITDARAKRAIDRLVRDGLIVRAVDRAKDKEFFFHRDAIADAQRRLAPLLEKGPGMLVTEIGAVLSISRKYSMPLLEHLDTIRFTRRIDDRRTLHGLRYPPETI